ncbi:efflux transporter outer membrane subunit [Halioxenophilus aromaticivorans]|uniref:Efflux transporter outer membrane subunit n=1 Tax=Halioxenophilus aromaticivorans TaxID=1306992 RepID=A0AAV3U7L5_9ALTE
MKLMLKTLALASSISLLTACAVGPDYQQPVVAEPEAFKYHQGWMPMPEQSWEATGLWWHIFDDPVLGDLITIANDNNQSLAQAEANYRAALAQRGISRSDYFPTVNAGVSGDRSGGNQSQTSEQAQASVSVGWELDVWGRIRRQVEASNADLEASAADLAAAKLSIQLSVTNSYLNLRALEQLDKILQQTLTAYERSTQLTTNQYDAGIVARADVIQAETQLQSLKSDVFDLQQQKAQEQNTLAVLLGQAPSMFEFNQAGALPAVPNVPARLPSQLISRRPDVIAAERSVASANANIGVAISAWLPDISLSGSYGTQASSFSDLLDAPVRVWSVGPSLAQLLFAGGRRGAARDAAIASYEAQVAVYRQTVLESLAEVENALATSFILAEKSVQQKKLVELAEQNETLVTNRYKTGLVTFLEVATAQNSTLSARRELVNLTTEQLTASATLAAAIGGAWD